MGEGSPVTGWWWRTGAAVIGGATGAVTTSSFTGDGTNGELGQAYDVYEFTGLASWLRRSADLWKPLSSAAVLLVARKVAVAAARVAC